MGTDQLIIKLPCLIVLLVCHHLAFGRPTGPPPSEAERKGYKEAGKDSLPSFVTGLGRDLYANLLQFLTLSEMYVLLCNRYPALSQKHIVGVLVPNGVVSADIRMNSTFILGFVLTVIGAAIRVDCLHRLGSNFTFELTIRKGHALCTKGPYSVVRHPSYTAAVPYAIGLSLCHFCAGSWWVECGVSETIVGKVVGPGLAMWHIIVITSLIRRVATEDGMLKKTFGEEWVRNHSGFLP